jgi:hypothetical protein
MVTSEFGWLAVADGFVNCAGCCLFSASSAGSPYWVPFYGQEENLQTGIAANFNA